MRLDVGKTRLGDSEFLLTTRAEQKFVRRDGGEVVNHIGFSDCREYRGESTIQFETEGPLTAPAKGLAKATSKASDALSIPPGERFSLELVSPIDSATAAAGDRFAARLDSAIRVGKGLVIPKGAPVEGRLLRVETDYIRSEETIFVLRPESVLVGGTQVALRAVSGARSFRPTLVLPYTPEPNTAAFLVPGEHAVLQAGSISQWISR